MWNGALSFRQEGSRIRRNFFGGLWHGAFLALGMALTQPTTVISAFIADLTGSTVWVGGLATVLTVAGASPQILIAWRIEPCRRKKPFLLLAIYLRVLSWGVLAWLIFAIGSERPQLLSWALVGLLAVFYAGGGLGGVPYTDIIGKIIPPDRRGTFFGGRQALAAPLVVGGALLARHILATVEYPNNYALIFGAAAAALLVASLGFWLIREPPRTDSDGYIPVWSEYVQQLLAAARHLKMLVIVQLLTGFSLMAIPFYIVYVRKELGAPQQVIAWFILSQAAGGILANLLWAWLVDRRGSRDMLTACAMISMLTPLLAVGLGHLGWQAMLPVFFLMGASINGRSVGFSSALLELAPASRRPTYSALNALLILPVAFLSLAAGVLLQYWSYSVMFLLAAGIIGAGAVLTRRLPSNNQGGE